jgi:hypothetical protein
MLAARTLMQISIRPGVSPARAGLEPRLRLLAHARHPNP